MPDQKKWPKPTKPKTGGPAFPRAAFHAADVDGYDDRGSEGMSFRDFLAAKAMQALLTSTGQDTQSIALHLTSLEQGESWESVLAERAWAVADAMLAAR